MNGVEDPNPAPTWYANPAPTARTTVGNRSFKYAGTTPKLPTPKNPISSAPMISVVADEPHTKNGSDRTPTSVASVAAPRRPSPPSDQRPTNTAPATAATLNATMYGSV